MNTLSLPPTPNTVPTTVDLDAVSPRRRAMRRVGWALAGLATLAIGLTGSIAITSQAALLIVGSLTLLLLLGMLAAAGLLMWGYHEFFARARGFLLWTTVFLISVYFTSKPFSSDQGALVSAAMSILTLWGFVAALAIGPALLLYLVRTDRSVVLFGIVYLLLAWLLFTVGQALGWDVLLQRLVFGPLGQSLWALQGVLCIGIWVTITATSAFLWNTVVYLSREQTGVVRPLQPELHSFDSDSTS